MKEKRPENRYESFVAIREAIGKHDFLNMQVSKDDREIYQNFTNLVYRTISTYMEAPKFNTNPTTFAARLEKVLTTNLFETVVQKNADVIKGIVECSFRYDNHVDIQCETVRRFLDWFKSSTMKSQMLILNNFITKISDISINESEEELPF